MIVSLFTCEITWLSNSADGNSEVGQEATTEISPTELPPTDPQRTTAPKVKVKPSNGELRVVWNDFVSLIILWISPFDITKHCDTV